MAFETRSAVEIDEDQIRRMPARLRRLSDWRDLGL